MSKLFHHILTKSLLILSTNRYVQLVMFGITVEKLSYRYLVASHVILRYKNARMASKGERRDFWMTFESIPYGGYLGKVVSHIGHRSDIDQRQNHEICILTIGIQATEQKKNILLLHIAIYYSISSILFYIPSVTSSQSSSSSYIFQ